MALETVRAGAGAGLGLGLRAADCLLIMVRGRRLPSRRRLRPVGRHAPTLTILGDARISRGGGGTCLTALTSDTGSPATLHPSPQYVTAFFDQGPTELVLSTYGHSGSRIASRGDGERTLAEAAAIPELGGAFASRGGGTYPRCGSGVTPAGLRPTQACGRAARADRCHVGAPPEGRRTIHPLAGTGRRSAPPFRPLLPSHRRTDPVRAAWPGALPFCQKTSPRGAVIGASLRCGPGRRRGGAAAVMGRPALRSL